MTFIKFVTFCNIDDDCYVMLCCLHCTCIVLVSYLLKLFLYIAESHQLKYLDVGVQYFDGVCEGLETIFDESLLALPNQFKYRYCMLSGI